MLKVQSFSIFIAETLALSGDKIMIKYQDPNQITLDQFIQPFGGKLNSENRWVKEAALIPWNPIAEIYYSKMCSNFGAPAKDARIVTGAIIIKSKFNLSDEETAEQIRENPYFQFFLGLKEYTDKYVFHPSLFVAIRKRLGDEEFNKMSYLIIEKSEALQAAAKAKNEKKKEKTESDSSDSNSSKDKEKIEQPENKGKLILDATVANQAIKYPNDLDLLNDAREFTEQFIDHCHESFKLGAKPRTYRVNARKEYLSVVKLKKKSLKKIRKAVGKQLNYLRRNLEYLEIILTGLTKLRRLRLSASFWVKFWRVQELYRQQKEMHSAQTHRCDDRIVNISQPHIRPIVRGKVKAPVEFGAKIGISLVNGFATIDNLSFDAYHESIDLKTAVENYKNMRGFYPEVVIVDPAYGTRENRQFLKNLNIRFGGKPVGAHKKETPENKEELKTAKERRRLDYLLRITVEGKFGQGKGRYRLNYIRAKLASTTASWIGAIFFVMNLAKMTKILACHILFFILNWFYRQYSGKLSKRFCNNQFCVSYAG